MQRFVHPLDPLTLRLFMAFVTLVAALTVWWYARRLLSSTGALVAGLAYPTMGHVFDLGRRAETDGLFALLLAAALLVWHHGYDTGWRRTTTWVAGGLLASLAALTKGMQAPIAFFGTVYLFLAYRRELRSLLRVPHLVGLLAFAVPIAIWQVPFFERVGWEGTRMTWFDPGTSRVGVETSVLVRHFAKFPFEVLGAMLPWSVLLLGGLDRRFWRQEPRHRATVVFLLLGIVTIVGPVWVSDGLPRYIMATYPLVAVLCGVVVDRVLAVGHGGLLGELWRWTARGWSTVCAGFLVVVLAATIAKPRAQARWSDALAQPWWILAGFGVLVVVLVPFVWRRARSNEASPVAASALGLAFLLAGLFNGPVLQILVQRTEHLGPEVQAVHQRLPAGARLVSFEPLHHRFVYFWGEPIPILPWPERAADVPSDVVWFALNASFGETRELPFPWKPVAELNMNPRIGDPTRSVIVAKRLPE